MSASGDLRAARVCPQPWSAPRTGHPSCLGSARVTSHQETFPLHSHVWAEDSIMSPVPWLEEEGPPMLDLQGQPDLLDLSRGIEGRCHVSGVGSRGRTSRGSCDWRPAWRRLQLLRCECRSLGESAHSLFWVWFRTRCYFREISQGQSHPGFMRCFLNVERSHPRAGLAREAEHGLAPGRFATKRLPSEGSRGQASTPWPSPHWPAWPLPAEARSCSTSTSRGLQPPRRLLTPDSRSLLTSAGWPLQLLPPPPRIPSLGKW